MLEVARRSGNEVVDRPHPPARRQQSVDQMAADETGAAGDQVEPAGHGATRRRLDEIENGETRELAVNPDRGIERELVEIESRDRFGHIDVFNIRNEDLKGTSKNW